MGGDPSGTLPEPVSQHGCKLLAGMPWPAACRGLWHTTGGQAGALFFALSQQKGGGLRPALKSSQNPLPSHPSERGSAWAGGFQGVRARCCLQQGTDLPGFWEGDTTMVRAAERITGKSEERAPPFPPEAFWGSSVPSISHAAANDPVNRPLSFCPMALVGLVGSRRKGGHAAAVHSGSLSK